MGNFTNNFRRNNILAAFKSAVLWEYIHYRTQLERTAVFWDIDSV